jgi:hypothetical protein
MFVRFWDNMSQFSARAIQKENKVADNAHKYILQSALYQK